LAATRAIRSNTRFAQLPILAMTANAMTGDRERSLEAGMNDHLTKPIDQEVLFSALLRWIAPRLEADQGHNLLPRLPLVQADEAGQCPFPALEGIDVERGLVTTCVAPCFTGRY
jgi:two-component system sensor histidine kinase/response regulator